MTPKEKLESIQSLATDIDILSAQIHNLYTVIGRPPSSKVTVSYGTTPGTTADGYTEKTLVKFLKLKKERMQAIITRHSRIFAYGIFRMRISGELCICAMSSVKRGTTSPPPYSYRLDMHKGYCNRA